MLFITIAYYYVTISTQQSKVGVSRLLCHLTWIHSNQQIGQTSPSLLSQREDEQLLELRRLPPVQRLLEMSSGTK